MSEIIKIENIEKLLANLHYKEEYVIHIRNLKQALSHGLVLKKVDRVIRFNQKGWLELYIDMNTELRKSAKNYFEKYFFLSWCIIQFLKILWKMWENTNISNL